MNTNNKDLLMSVESLNKLIRAFKDGFRITDEQVMVNLEQMIEFASNPNVYADSLYVENLAINVDDALDNETFIEQMQELIAAVNSGSLARDVFVKIETDTESEYYGYWLISDDGGTTWTPYISAIGPKGDSYTLTEEDKAEIANQVEDNLEGTLSTLQQGLSDANGVLTEHTAQISSVSAGVTSNAESIANLNDYVRSLTHLSFLKVNSLEDITEPSVNVIYIVPVEGEDYYEEFIYLEDTGEYELMGTTRVDLSNYVTLTAFEDAVAEIEALQAKVAELQSVRYYKHNIQLRYRDDTTSLLTTTDVGKCVLSLSITNQTGTSYQFARYSNQTNLTPPPANVAWQLYRFFRDMREGTVYSGHSIANICVVPAWGTVQYAFKVGTLSYGNINRINTRYTLVNNSYYRRELVIPFSRLDAVEEFNQDTIIIQCGKAVYRTTDVGGKVPVPYTDDQYDEWLANDYGDGTDYVVHRIEVVDWVERAYPL